jgi:hypothetical protein
VAELAWVFNHDKEHRRVDYLAPTVVFIVLRMLFLYGADGLVRSVYSAR